MNKKTILIVEDELSLRSALSEKLSKEDFEILEANDGQEGLDIAFKEHPDLILLDIIMPIMDGIKMLSKLREDDWGKTVPVLILTNLSDEEKTSEAVEKGVSDYLIKSDYSLEDLMEKIKEKLNK